MSEAQFDHWLNLPSETQMQTLGALILVAQLWLSDAPHFGCTTHCGRCPECRARDALARLDGRQMAERG